MGGAKKGAVGGANKSGADGANIEANEKVGARAFTNSNNNADSGAKIFNWHAGLENLAFATFAAANCAENSNFAIFKGTLLSIASYILNKFFATFAALTNIALERELKVYKSNLFLFATNH